MNQVVEIGALEKILFNYTAIQMIETHSNYFEIKSKTKIQKTIEWIKKELDKIYLSMIR